MRKRETSFTNAAPGRSLEVKRHVLSNGLIVLLAENRHVPALSIDCSVNAGARYESEAQAGLAELTAAMLSEGTVKRSAEQIAETIESVGGMLQTGAGSETISAVLTVLKKDVKLGLDLLSEVILQPAFPEEKLSKEKAKTVAEIQSASDRPRVVCDWTFNDLIYGTHPLHRPSVGYEATVRSFTREDCRAWHGTFFAPNNTCLAAVGDFDSAELLDLLERKFAESRTCEYWTRRAVNLPAVPRIERQAQPIEKRVTKEKEQVHIALGHLGITRMNPDYYALQVMDTILGSSPGFTSRIPRRLRDEQGLAYTTFAHITHSAGLDPGRFLAYIATSAENRDRAISGLRHEIENFLEDGAAAGELTDAQSYLTGSVVFHFQTNLQIAQFLINAERYGLGFDYLEKYPRWIAAVTLEEVTRVARTYLDPARMTLVVVGPS